MMIHISTLSWRFGVQCPECLLFSLSFSPSTAVTPTSTSAANRLGSSQVPTTPITPSATSAASPTATTPSTPAVSSLAAGAANPTQPIQLRDLQSILATMNVPASGQGGEKPTTVKVALGKAERS